MSEKHDDVLRWPHVSLQVVCSPAGIPNSDIFMRVQIATTEARLRADPDEPDDRRRFCGE